MSADLIQHLRFHGRYGHETEDQAKLRRVQRNEAAATELERLTAELAAARELADSEGTRAVDYMRRARKAEKLLREVLDALPGLQAPNCLGMDLYQRVSAATAPKAERAAIDAARQAG